MGHWLKTSKYWIKLVNLTYDLASLPKFMLLAVAGRLAHSEF